MKISEYLHKTIGPHCRETQGGMWFHCPWRQDTHSSLQVNDGLGKWHDWGTGESGDVYDLAMKINNCDFKTAKKILDEPLFSTKTIEKINVACKKRKWTAQTFLHSSLIEYAMTRGVKESVLRKYCIELVEGNFFYIALPNCVGGYAVRNKNFKGQKGNQSFSFFIGNNHLEVLVFEGMFDMLSFVSISNTNKTIIVLNSTTNVNKAIETIKTFNIVHCYLDNDKAGVEALKLIKQSHLNVIDHSYVYREYNDVNDYIVKTSVKSFVKQV